ncbi:MAG: ribonuclease HI family protein [Candidatus Odinarchaeia archaeon]
MKENNLGTYLRCVHIYSDGGSRGNWGPCAIGIVLCDEKGGILTRYSEFIGFGTNNWAEYWAVIRGLELGLKFTSDTALCFSDSQLIVNQLKGIYRVKSERLKPLFLEVKQLERKFRHVDYVHLNRTHKMMREADSLLNIELDKTLKKKKG